MSDVREQQRSSRTAKDVKELHARFNDWLDSDLDEIPVLPEGARLDQNATYVDLSLDEPVEFTATGDMEAGPGQFFVPKDDVPYQIWNRLRGRFR